MTEDRKDRRAPELPDVREGPSGDSLGGGSPGEEGDAGLFGGDLDEGLVDGLFDSLIAPEDDPSLAHTEVEVGPDDLPPALDDLEEISAEAAESPEGLDADALATAAAARAEAMAAARGASEAAAPAGAGAHADPGAAAAESAESLESVEELVDIDFETPLSPQEAGIAASATGAPPPPPAREGTLRELFGFRGAVPQPGAAEGNTPLSMRPAPAGTVVAGPQLAAPAAPAAAGPQRAAPAAPAAAPAPRASGAPSADFLADEDRAYVRPAPAAAPGAAPPDDGAPDALAGLLRPPPRPADFAVALRFADAAAPAAPPAPRDRIEPTKVERSRWEELAALYESEIELTRDRTRLVTLHFEAARTRAERLGDPGAADQHLEAALKLNPRHRPSLQMLRRSHVRAQRWDQAVKAIDAEIGLVRDPQEIALLTLRKGRILELHPGQSSDGAARACYEKAREVDRGNRSATCALEDLAYARSDWKSFLQLERAEAEAAGDPAERAAIHLEIAAVEELVQKDVRGAGAAYQNALAADAASPGAAFGVVRTARARDDHALESAAHEADAALAADPLALGRRLWAASLGAARVKDHERADALLQQAAAAAPAPPVLAALIEAHARAGRDAERVEALRALVRALEPGAARAELHLEAAATLSAALGKGDAALEEVERARSHVADHATARNLQLRLLHGAHRFADLAKAWEQSAEGTKGRARAAALLVAADVRERLGGDPAGASETIARALADAPDDPLALDGARRLWGAAGQWEKLADAARAASFAADDPDRKRAALLWTAELLERRTGGARAADALEAYRLVLALAPADQDALAGVARLEQARGAGAGAATGRELAAALDARADAASALEGAEALAAELRWAAGQAHEAAGDAGLARERYREASGAGAPGGSPGAALDYERLLCAGGRVEDLVALRSAELAALGDDGDPAARAALLLHVGEMLETELSKPDDARDRYRQALAAAPEDLDAARALQRRMLAADELGPFADALVEDSRRRRDPRRRAAGLLHAAQIVERRLGDADRAATLYREALAADPGSIAAREALHDLLASRGDATALAALYGAQLGDDPPASALLHHARWLAEIEGERPQALAQAERARDKDPGNAVALRLCETLAARLGRWADWTKAQEGLAARFPEPADALEYLLGAALAKEAEPDAGAGLRPAHDDYRAALGLAPENVAVQLWLYHLARGSSESAALAEVLDRMAASARDGLARAAVLTRLGDLRPDAAEVLWRQALEAYPELLPALKQLRRRAEDSVDHEAVATLSELEAVAAVDPVQKAAAWLRAGDAAAGPLADAARARAALGQVLALEPGNDDAFERLMELLAAADDPAALRAALQHRIEAQHEPSALVPLLLRIGELSRDRLGQREDAKRAFARATALDPRSLPALVALGDLYNEDGQWQEAAGAAARVIKLSTERPVLRAHFTRLGTLYADHLVDPHKAIECFRRAANLADGGDVAALERLVELHRRQGDWASAVEVTTRLVAAARDPGDKIRHLLGLASIHEQGRMDSKAALMEIRRALQVDSGDLDALEALAGLFERGGNQRARQMELERAAQIFVARVKSAPTDPTHYRGLLTVQTWAGLTRQGGATAEALEVLGVTDPEVQAARSMLPPPQAAAFPNPAPLFGRESEERWSAGASFTVNVALAEIGPWAPRVFQIDAARFGAGKAERVAAGPVKDLCDHAARAFGVGPYELYVSRRVPTAAAAIPGEPPQIVLGAGVVEGATPAELRFVAARCMVLIRRGHGVVPFVSADDFGRLLAAAAAAGEVAGKADAAQLEVNKALYKALPRKSRKELAPIALELVARTAEAPALQSAIIQDANRVALAACDQLTAAVDALGRMNGVVLRALRDPAARVRAIAPIVEITALLAFSITDQRQEMRRLVGLG